MTLGFYENFPSNVHLVESYNSTVSSKLLQQRIAQVLYEVNKKEFSFEEVANPTVPECKLIFEFGLADAENFNYIDEEEVNKILNLPEKELLRSIDFFCVIRYYRGEKKKTLKFDYYFLRTLYGRSTLEIQISHKKGPRYLSPEDLTGFIVNKINEATNRKILKNKPVA